MKRAKVVAAAMCFVGLAAAPEPAVAQTSLSADLGLFSSYVWRGLSLTNKPVAQPDVYLSLPAGNATITLGGWANIDLGRYDDPDDDISESGALSSFNLSEFNPYAEISVPVGKATLTGGIIGYVYPNEVEAGDEVNDFGLLTSEANTVELYGTVGLDVPLSPQLSVYYDADKIKGAYIEGAVSHDLPVSEAVSISLGALAGLSAGQGIPEDPGSDESSNFDDDGFTHLDLSAGVPFGAGSLSITPALHVVINGDDRVKITSPTNDSDVKLWGGVTISWSLAFGEVPEEE